MEEFVASLRTSARWADLLGSAIPPDEGAITYHCSGKGVEKVVHAVTQLLWACIPADSVCAAFRITVACQRLVAVLTYVGAYELNVWSLRVGKVAGIVWVLGVRSQGHARVPLGRGILCRSNNDRVGGGLIVAALSSA